MIAKTTPGTDHEEEHGPDKVSETPSSVASKSSSITAAHERSAVKGPQLVEKETKIITWSKVAVAFVLLFATAAAATTTYRYTSQQDEIEFKTRFEDTASQIISVYETNTKKFFDVYDTLSLQVTIQVLESSEEWPYVTIPRFEAIAEKVLNQTAATNFGLAVYVPAVNRTRWENYSDTNQGWRQEGYDYHNSGTTASPVVPFIWNSFQAFGPANQTQQGRSGYLPMWQTAPILTSTRLSNFDAFALGDFGSVFDRARKLRSPTLSRVRPESLNKTANLEDGAYASPDSYIVAPIFEDVGSDKVVGALTSLLQWKTYFINLLPEGTSAVVLVIRSTCNQTQSYLIEGPDVKYLGPSDLHDAKFDAEMVETVFTPFSEAECLHTLELYPSQDFQDRYTSLRPITYTISVIFIFILTASVFVGYDCLVERRQGMVMNTAQRSTAIVSSLFPATVRDRLMDEVIAMQTDSHDKALERDHSSKLVSSWSAYSPSDRRGNEPRSSSSASGGNAVAIKEGGGFIPRSKPIADLFPDVTVLFADIVGFTAWASTREPTEVFTLLEAIYNPFDRIARRLKVFKVETIGDCYVAATGLPEKLDDHAVVMAKFALNCMVKMAAVVNGLEGMLGKDTNRLSMRFGIHSGPVTAGVLRGEKSRFQLFGDTVNTAARMESTGSRGCIHLSEETAKLVMASSNCMGLHVVPRKEHVQVKGKGKLQTYWLTTRRADNTNAVQHAVQPCIIPDATGPTSSGKIMPLDCSSSSSSSTKTRSDHCDY